MLRAPREFACAEKKSGDNIADADTGDLTGIFYFDVTKDVLFIHNSEAAR